MTASASPSTTDEARAEAAQRGAAAEQAASLRQLPGNDERPVRITDTDSARMAVAQTNRRREHDAYLAEVLRAGAGVNPAPIRVTDTDSARAAAARQIRATELRADYAEYVRMHGQAARDGNVTSKR